MRLRIPVFVACAVVSSIALAGGVTADTQPSGVTVIDVVRAVPWATLLLVAIVYSVLFKFFARWPHHERWLVGAALLALPPLATAGGYFTYWFHLYTGSTTPIRDTVLFWAVVALLFAGAWWVLKTKTTLLTAPAAAGKAVQDAQAFDQDVWEWAATKFAQGKAAAAAQAAPQQAPAPASQPEPKPARPAARTNDAIFISYRRQDSADATGRIYDRLIQHFGRDQVFKDVDSIPLGVDFREHLGNVVGRCNTLIAVIGPQWKSATGPNGRRLEDKSDFVRVEIEAALARNIPVIPVLIGGAELPADTELPPSIAAITYRNGISVRPDPDFHRDMDRLIAGLEQHGHG